MRVLEAFRDSLIALWEPISGADRYRVQWHDDATGAFLGSKWVTQTATQIQPLTPDVPVSILMTPYTASGAGVTQEAHGVAPRGTYEAGLLASIENGGFLFDPKYDRMNRGVDPAYLKTVTNGNQWPPDYEIQDDFGWSGAFVNHQHHWHQFICDGNAPGAVAAISSRCELPIDLSRGVWPVTVLYDCDKGPTGRQLFYVVLLSEKRDFLTLKPNESDNKPISETAFDVRIQGVADILNLRVYEANTLREFKAVSRGRTWSNVRQIMGYRLWPDRIELLIDRGYTGTPEVAHTVYTDVTRWPSQLWLYFSIGSYNGRKINILYGHRPSGEKIHQNPYGLWHLGQVMHDGNALRQCNCDEGHNPFAGEEETPTDPTPVPVLDTMPPHEYLREWVVPIVKVNFPHPLQANRYPDVFSVQVQADSRDSTAIAADALLINRVRLERIDKDGGRLLIGERVIDPPRAFVQAAFPVDTTAWEQGYYSFNAVAVTESGSDGEHYSSDIYTVIDTANVLIWRKPYNGKPPEVFLRAESLGQNVKMEPGAIIPVAVDKRFSLYATVETKSLLTEIVMEMFGADGKWHNWLADWNATGYHPKVLSYQHLTGGNLRCAMTYSDFVKSWYPRDTNNQIKWRVRVRDADGIESIFPFLWQF